MERQTDSQRITYGKVQVVPLMITSIVPSTDLIKKAAALMRSHAEHFTDKGYLSEAVLARGVSCALNWAVGDPDDDGFGIMLDKTFAQSGVPQSGVPQSGVPLQSEDVDDGDESTDDHELHEVLELLKEIFR